MTRLHKVDDHSTRTNRENRVKGGQRERFEQVARELDVDLDEEKLREALRKIAPDTSRERKDREND